MIQDLRYVRNFLTLNYIENMKNYLISIGGNSTSDVLSIESNFEEIIAVDSGIEHLFQSFLKSKYFNRRFRFNIKKIIRKS